MKHPLSHSLPSTPSVSHSPSSQPPALCLFPAEIPRAALTFHHAIPSSRHKVLLVGMQAGDCGVMTREGSHTGTTVNIPAPTENHPKRGETRLILRCDSIIISYLMCPALLPHTRLQPAAVALSRQRNCSDRVRLSTEVLPLVFQGLCVPGTAQLT